jgi:tRNA (guanine-N7-)-methyltransferase
LKAKLARLEATSNPAQRTLIYELPSIIERLDLTRLFSIQQRVEAELGSGDGSFLVEYASRHPERNFIGIERLLGRIQKLSRKAIRTGLGNVAGIRIESSYFLEYLLPENSVAALHIYFPDPWPKRKHQENRLINERFPELASRVLQPQGVVYLRTDDADYFEQIVEVFGGSARFHQTDTPAELSATLTDFEKDFLARGIQTVRAAYELI